MATRVISKLASAELVRRVGHTGILVAAVALGTALITAIQAVNASTLRSFEDTIGLLEGEAQLQVRARAAGVPEGVVSTVAEVPGVDHASALISGSIWVTEGPARGETLSVFGVDLGDDRAIRTYRVSRQNGEESVEDPLVFLAQPDSVMLARQLLARVGLAVGDRLVVLTPTGERTLTIRGALDPEGMGRLYGGSLAVMDLYAAQRLLGRQGTVDQIDVVAAAPFALDALKAQLAAALPPSLEVVSPQQRSLGIERLLRTMQAVLGGISALGLLFGAFVSYNVAGTAIIMRLKDLGTLRCVGASRSQMRGLVLVETVLPALAGSAVGVGVGAVLAEGICGPLAQGLSYGIRVALPVESAHVPLTAVPLAVVAGVGSALLGAWGPAAAAARLDPGRIGQAPEALRARRLAALGAVALVPAGALLAVAAMRESGLFANLAILLLNGSIVLLGLAALPGLGTWVHRALGWLGAYGQVAGDALARAPLRASVTVAVIAMALTITLTIGSVVSSFKGSILKQVRAHVAADLIVALPFRSQAWIEAPMTEDVAQEIATLPGVQRIAAVRFADVEQEGERVMIRAYDRAFLEDPRFGAPLFRAGRPAEALRAVSDGRGVLVSENLAEGHDLRVGDPYTLRGPEGDLTLPVVGIVTDLASETGTVTVDREVYARAWHDRLVNEVLVLAEPGTDTSELQPAIGRRFAGRVPLEIITAGDYRARFEHDVDGVFSFLVGLRIAIIALAAMGIADTLLGLGLARARELGVLRALGARRQGIFGLFALEALVSSALGIALGILGALALSGAWVLFLSYQLGWRLELHLPLAEYVELGALTWVLAAVAVLAPVAGLARRPPAALLAYE